MSDEMKFSPEFSKSLKKIAETFKGIEIPLNDPLDNLPRFENFANQYDFLDNIELPVNPTYELIEKQEEANKLLGYIVENTSVLKELVEINRETQLNTEELTSVMRAIYDVAKANDKREADTFLKKAIKTINDSGESASNIASLVSFLMGIYNTVITLFIN